MDIKMLSENLKYLHVRNPDLVKSNFFSNWLDAVLHFATEMNLER
jgi:hypothetical protein